MIDSGFPFLSYLYHVWTGQRQAAEDSSSHCGGVLAFLLILSWALKVLYVQFVSGDCTDPETVRKASDASSDTLASATNNRVYSR